MVDRGSDNECYDCGRGIHHSVKRCDDCVAENERQRVLVLSNERQACTCWAGICIAHGVNSDLVE